jgi:HK97 gp10 family phage protein
MAKTINHKEFAVELDLLNRAIRDSVDEALVLESMVQMAKVFCPVDTGALQDSIRAERRGDYSAALVAGGVDYINPRTGKSVDYAVYVHEGTSRMPARPFLTQAVEREKLPWARKVLTETLERI